MRRPLRLLAKAIVLVTLLGIGLTIASQFAADHPEPRAPSAPLPDTWLDIRRPLPLYTLTGTDFAKLPLDYMALRQASGGGRRDILTYGDPHGDNSWLRLSLYRLGAEPGAAEAVGEDLAANAAALGFAVIDRGGPTSLTTRFGAFEAADLRLSVPAGPRSCLGFHSLAERGMPLRIEGLACGGPNHPIGRDLLSCVIDRIDLLSAGDDGILRDIFVAAERRRGFACLPAPLTPAAKSTTWLDANSAAPLLKPLTASRTKTW